MSRCRALAGGVAEANAEAHSDGEGVVIGEGGAVLLRAPLSLRGAVPLREPLPLHDGEAVVEAQADVDALPLSEAVALSVGVALPLAVYDWKLCVAVGSPERVCVAELVAVLVGPDVRVSNDVPVAVAVAVSALVSDAAPVADVVAVSVRCVKEAVPLAVAEEEGEAVQVPGSAVEPGGHCSKQLQGMQPALLRSARALLYEPCGQFLHVVGAVCGGVFIKYVPAGQGMAAGASAGQ